MWYIAIYPLAVIFAFMFAKNEYAIAGCHAALWLLRTFYPKVLPQHIIFTSVITGVIFAIASYISSKYYALFTFPSAKNTLPVWYPITWALVAYCILDIARIIK
jgi:hypothetical protein